MPPAIRVENLSKRYRISHEGNGGGNTHGKYKTLRDTLADLAAAPFRRLKNRGESSASAASQEDFFALKDVSFDVEPGEVVGIIGRNGSGKSTLLKILSRITKPSSGRVTLNGRVGSLLEVGTGFHAELTGRENIFLNGSILGMTRNEIQKQFDAIVDFSGVAKFLDTPVKRYSSGMYVRLAFAVAAYLEPEILIVDEVLAVGDAEFQKKCLGKMHDISKTDGRTVFFVSHNMGAVSQLCSRVLWLEQGTKKMDAPTKDVITQYLTSGASMNGYSAWPEGIANHGVEEFKLDFVGVKTASDEISPVIDSSQPFTVELRYRLQRALPYCRVGFILAAADGTAVFDAYDSDDPRFIQRRTVGPCTIVCEIPRHLLSPGRYTISVNAGIPNIKNFLYLQNVLILDIADGGVSRPYAGAMGKREGIIRPALEWR